MAMEATNPDGSLRNRTDMLARAVYSHGPAAPESPNTNGSRQESWATATVSCGAESQSRKQELGCTESGGGDLQAAVQTTNGKLNPRWVETLMGLPVGWVMPSCKSPVTIELTNSDSSETEWCPPPPTKHFSL
jgi:hypothetical protein